MRLVLPLALTGWGLMQPVGAQVTATGAGGLNTAVNGVVGGSCSSGLCQVSGGTGGGNNLFHQFSSFDTRGAISGVQIHNGGFSNVVVGVTAPLGSFIDKPVSLSTPGSLFWLSPGGIAVTGAGGFVNTTQLTLSTATSQRIGEGRFDVFGTTPQQAALLTGRPGTAAADLVLDPAVRALAGMAPDPEIVLQGIQLTVDRSLLVDNPGGLVSVAGSTLSAASASGTGGSITLTGPQVWVDGLSSLLATGPGGGGLIQVGGSWQNNDPSVRQAVRTWIGSGALLDASATVNGTGGTVVAWSDITNPLGSTVVSGTLLAKGGPEGGDGGRIETSGTWLNVDGISVSTSAPLGRLGTWLLDPNDLTISNATYVNISPTPSTQGGTYTATGTTSNFNVNTLNQSLVNANVALIASGDITVQNQIQYAFTPGSTAGSLSLQAGGGIVLNAGISLSVIAAINAPSVTLTSGTGGLSGSGGVFVQVSGAAPAAINITQGGNSTYSGILAGTNTVLVKGGAGTLTLAGASTYTGQTTVQGGSLRAQNSAAFGTGLVAINPGAAVELAGGITLANNFTTMGTGVGLGGAIRNISGANTITGSVALQFSSNLFTADAGSLTFDRPGATSSAVTVGGAYNTLDLVFAGAGDLVFNDPINLSYSLQGTTVYGSLSKGGAGTLFLNAANQLGTTLGVNGGTLAYSSTDFFSGAAQASRTLILDGGVLRSQVSHTLGSTANGTFLLGTNGGTWQVDPGISVSFPGAMSGTGAFTKSGQGQLTLSGASTYQGITTVAGGTLLITGSLPSNSPLTVGTGALMQLGVNSTIGSIAGSGGINLSSFTLTAGGNNNSTTFSGSISGTGNLIKTGTGTLTLTGANTYSGTTTVTGGTLTVNQQPPSTATCNGGSSNICPTATVSPVQVQTLLTPTISVTPGFSISSTTTATPTTTSTTTTTTSTTTTSTTSSTSTSGSSSSSTDSSSSSSGTSTTTAGTTATTTTTSDVQPVTTVPADGTTLISNANVAVLSSLESSFSTVDVGGSASASGVSSAGAPTSTSSTGSSSSTSGSDSSSTSSGARSSSSSSSAAATSTSSESGSTSDQGKADQAKADQGKADSGKSDSAGADKQESGQQSTAPAASQSAGASASAPPPTVTVPAQQAAASSQQSDLQSGQQALGSLAPERAGGALVAPSVPQMQQSLSGATNQVRNGGLGPQSALPQGWGDAERWLLAAGALPVSSDAGRGALLPPTFNRAAYTPAVLHVRFSEARGGTVRPDTDAFLDITLVPMEGEVEGRRVEVSKQEFATLLKKLYTQLSRQESLNTADPASPARRLQQLLIGPMAPVLASRRITTLLIAADRGLQAVPFAALHDGQRYFGDAYAFSLTPSLALTSLAPPQPARGRLLAAGSAVFDGLAPLPLVPAELDQVGRSDTKDKALNKAFTPSTLLDQAADPRYSRVHVATHAEFLPGGPAASRLYSGTVPIPLSDFVKLRRARQGAPLDLISFSACRTALGDADSELGFAGLALQAGARSAVGTLWYVDDVATSAYFVQMYRYLEAGIPKAEALQLTRQAFSHGLVRLDGDRLVGADGQALLSGLTASQQRRVAGGLENPYFWAGIELLGAAW